MNYPQNQEEVQIVEIRITYSLFFINVSSPLLE